MRGSPSARRGPLLRAAIIATLLYIVWLLWSGLYKPLLLGLGVVSCALTVYVLRRMGYFSHEAADTDVLRYGPRLVGFWGWLGKEIVLSSLDVARQVLKPTIDVAPRTVRLNVEELDTLDQAVLGNSITLTPGTLTLDVHEGRMLVHALTRKSVSGLEQGEMYRRIRALRKR